MSMPHNFTDDPNQFPGPPPNSSNTTVILVAIAIVCGTLMLICGGLIFGVVMTVKQAQQDFEQVVMDEAQWQSDPAQSSLQEYNEFVSSGRYSEAIESADAGLEFDPDNAMLHNNKAWLLATCPDETVRDGELAVEHATKACDLTSWKSEIFVDTAAAAYAEAGDFESAVKWQEEAMRLDDGSYRQQFQRRLRLFKAGKPYREAAPSNIDPADESSVESEFEEAAEATESTTTDEATTP